MYIVLSFKSIKNESNYRVFGFEISNENYRKSSFLDPFFKKLFKRKCFNIFPNIIEIEEKNNSILKICEFDKKIKQKEVDFLKKKLESKNIIWKEDDYFINLTRFRRLINTIIFIIILLYILYIICYSFNFFFIFLRNR